MLGQNPQKSLEMCYFSEFRFKQKKQNPYDTGLEQFDQFVLRDHQGEEFKGLWNQTVFSNQNEIFAEVGSGYGDFMLSFCEKNPLINFVGMDYRFKRSFNLAKKLSKMENPNFRYLRSRGERLPFLFAENELSGLFYFFPDPWAKKRQQKKRLFNSYFLAHVEKLLKQQGKFYIKTDHSELFQWMKEVLVEHPTSFKVELETEDLYAQHPDHFLASFQTKFEKIFLSQGIKIKALVLINQKKLN